MTASESRAHQGRERSASRNNGGTTATSRAHPGGSALCQAVESSGLEGSEDSVGGAFTQATVTVAFSNKEMADARPVRATPQHVSPPPSVVVSATQPTGAYSMGKCPQGSTQQGGCVGQGSADQDIIHARLCTWLHDQRGQIWAYCFDKATRTPPITKQSLSELDIGAIINNPKLRHDVNFDRELHFRPNFDGHKGRHKLKVAEEYWRALAGELDLYNIVLGPDCEALQLHGFSQQSILHATSRRLPTMFDTIRDILKNLVPERDQGRVDEQLDTRMLMQKIEKGVCDLAALAEWTSLLLKTHCAPMRDEMVDEMVAQVQLGVAKNQAGNIVSGLQKLLGILEAMKLDVANHQIRHLRPLLIDDTINFERKSQEARISRKRVRTTEACEWLQSTATSGILEAFDSDGQIPSFDSLTKSVISELLSSGQTEVFPDTFYLDLDRLRTLKADIRDILCFEACLETFHALLERQPCARGGSIKSEQVLETRLVALVSEGNVDNRRNWLGNVGNIAAELVRLADSSDGTVYIPNAQRVQNVEAELHKSLPCNSRTSDYFSKHGEKVADRLYDGVGSLISEYGCASPIDLFNALVAPSAPPPPPPPPVAAALTSRRIFSNEPLPPTKPDQMEDIVRRTAHIVILHWRIWSELVYLKTERPNHEPVSPATQTASPLQETWVVEGGQCIESDSEGETDSGLTLHVTRSNEGASSSHAPRPMDALPFHHHHPPHGPG